MTPQKNNSSEFQEVALLVLRDGGIGETAILVADVGFNRFEPIEGELECFCCV